MESSLHDEHWELIRNPAVLRRAAQIVAVESQADFHDPSLERQILGFARDQIIADISATIEAHRYIPEPKISQLIPKSTYSQRPGSVLPYRDRVLCQAILLCIAPEIDKLLSPNVWSWRVKRAAKNRSPDSIPKSGIFRDTDISKFPFLKNRTVRKYFDPFEPWYALWPKFDKYTLSYLKNSNFRWIVVSDIAGYFENIELSLLSRMLHRALPGSPRTINLLMDHFDGWVDTLYDGTRVDRGIPQGNSISGFVGNFFLKPVDDFFQPRKDLQYFRYVDDVRILARTEEAARRAALDLEQQIRGLKLNLQSAKTKILPAVEGLRLIHDTRLDLLDQAQTLVNRSAHGAAHTILTGIKKAPASSTNGMPLHGSKPPLSGLNLRTFRRWTGLHFRMGSDEPIKRLVVEIKNNPDLNLISDLEKCSRAFPGRKHPPQTLWSYIRAQGPEFAMQEAELVRVLRYFNYVPDNAYDWAETTALNEAAMPYLRLQAVLLLSRFPGFRLNGPSIIDICLASSDAVVNRAGIIASSLNDPSRIRGDIRKFEYLSSSNSMRLIQYLRAIRNDKHIRGNLLDHIFGRLEFAERNMYEYSYLLRFIASAGGDALRDLKIRSRGVPTAAKFSSAGKNLLRFYKNV